PRVVALPGEDEPVVREAKEVSRRLASHDLDPRPRPALPDERPYAPREPRDRVGVGRPGQVPDEEDRLAGRPRVAERESREVDAVRNDQGLDRRPEAREGLPVARGDARGPPGAAHECRLEAPDPRRLSSHERAPGDRGTVLPQALPDLRVEVVE